MLDDILDNCCQNIFHLLQQVKYTTNLDTKQSLMSTLEERLQRLPLDSDDIEKNWASLRDNTVLCTPNIQDNRKSTHKSFRQRLSASSVKTSR